MSTFSRTTARDCRMIHKTGSLECSHQRRLWFKLVEILPVAASSGKILNANLIENVMPLTAGDVIGVLPITAGRREPSTDDAVNGMS